MTISAERREELERSMFYCTEAFIAIPVEHGEEDISQDELRILLHDSARLERIEREVRELAGEYDHYGNEGVRAGITASELRAIVDTGRGDE